VRDLLVAPRRFSDLMALLGGITPKTLSQRLRELQDAGIVALDREPGRREGWYKLTPSGQDLAPAIESLFLWGLRHAGRPPLPGEAVNAEHLLSALRISLDQAPPPKRSPVWQLRFADAGDYTLRHDQRWVLTPGIDEDQKPDVTVGTDTASWTRFLMTPASQRPAQPPGVELRGSAAQVRRFLELLAPFPYDLAARPA
jgi:DNA-binding HxlR family transcriptional regulator